LTIAPDALGETYLRLAVDTGIDPAQERSTACLAMAPS